MANMNKNGQDKIRDIIELSEVIGPTDALEPSAKPKSGRRAQAELLVEVAADVELFCGPDKTAYVDVHVNGHRETWPLDGSDFEQWLAHRFYQQTQTVPNSDAWRSALKILQAKARFEAPVRNVHVRVAGLGDRIYLDLADADWQVVEISPDSWRVIKNPPVRFRRPAGMLALPVPETGGSIEALRQFLNVERDGDFVISTAWLVAAFHPQGPYPVMVVTGEQGAAKSAFCNVLRRIVDPHEEPLPSVPRNEEDLFVAAQHAHVLGFDNVSVLKPEMSDACCRLASGGAYVARKLYTNREQSVLRA